MKQIKVLFYMMAGFAFFMSCDDNITEVSEIETEAIASEPMEIDIHSANLPNIQVVDVPIQQGYNANNVNTVLRFDSFQDYEYTQNVLYRLSEQHDDQFVSLYNHLSDDDLNDMETLINHDSEKPMTDFEDGMSFYSLRRKILEEEEIFLNQPDPSWDEDPDNHFIFDNEERALLNPNAQVLINDYLYTFTTDGYIINPIYNMEESQVILYDEDIGSNFIECRRRGRDVGYHEIGSEYRLKYKNRFRGRLVAIGFDRDKIKTKTNSYRRRNGRWKKWRTNIYAGINGQAYGSYIETPNTCFFWQNHHENGRSKRRKKIKFIIYGDELGLAGHHSLRLSPGEMFSVHRQGNNEYIHEIYD